MYTEKTPKSPIFSTRVMPVLMQINPLPITTIHGIRCPQSQSNLREMLRRRHPKNLFPSGPYLITTFELFNSSKHQSPNLNALPPLCPLGTPRVHKRRVRHPGPLLRVIALQHQPLVILHPAPIAPPLAPGVLDRGRLARAVRVPVLDADHGFVGHRRAIGEAERERLHGAVDGAPDVDDADAALEELGGFGGEVVAHAGLG